MQYTDLWRVVKEGECDDGDDVLLGGHGVHDVEERVAHREVPLQRDGHGEVDASGEPDLRQGEEDGQHAVVEAARLVDARQLREGEDQDAGKEKKNKKRGVD